jgi:DNA-binding NarL/FixJ family response regulator
MIKLAIIEDNEAYRKSLQALIVKAPDIEILYSDSNCSHLIQTIDVMAPDVIIMDIDLPGMSGIEGVHHLKKKQPDINIFMLTVFEDDEKIFDSIKAGAAGYLLKKDPPGLILDAIRKIHNGESVINGKIARKIFDYLLKKEQQRGAQLENYNLTKREKEVLQLLIDGLSYKLIAERCFISMDTLFSHIRKIYSKLNMHSRAEIAARFR